MPLVKNGEVIPDAFVRVDADAALPDGPVIVPLARLLDEAKALAGRNSPLGVSVPNSADVRVLEPVLQHLSVVVLDFPKFRDGRAYSQARLLRERLGYGGELRAAGNVLRDQFLFMVRCGFDAFEITKAADIHAMAEALKSYSVFYQPTADGRRTAAEARLSSRPA